MTDYEFLRRLAVAITQQEDLNDRDAQDVLYELALRIYALLLQRLPSDRLRRTLEWRRLRGEIAALIQAAEGRLGEALFSRLVATEALVLDIVRRYYGLRPEQLPVRSAVELLDTTRVMGTPVGALFVPTGTGLSPMAQQLLRLIERSINAGMFAEQPTAGIAERVVGTRTRNGATVAVVTKGTVANGWRERMKAITAAALWGLVTPAQQRANAATGRAATWRWNAVLDPRTCPICRPLHNTIAPDPLAFPQGPPPLHPFCRCVVIATAV